MVSEKQILSTVLSGGSRLKIFQHGLRGQRVYVTEVIADEFQLLESQNREGSSGNNNSKGAGGVPSFSREESPFGNSNPMDISDDDLPF